MAERIIAASPGREVLDVACGTGIAGRQFQAAGCKVLDVEPDPRMADFARARGLEVEVATFEAWDPAGRRFDAVIAGQSWHWVDPVTGAAKAAQVLLPGGRLALFGHVFEPPAEIAEAFAADYRRVVPGSPFNSQPAARSGSLPGDVCDFRREDPRHRRVRVVFPGLGLGFGLGMTVAPGPGGSARA